MPELPEVETVLRGLEPVIVGAQIIRAEVNRPDLRWPFPHSMAKRLQGARVLSLRRRSKYIMAALSTGETLLIHLGMSGRILLQHQSTPGVFHRSCVPQNAHDHVILHFNNGETVIFNDPRRFGAMDLINTDEVEKHWLLIHLGPEPLGNSFHGNYLASKLHGRKLTVKSALLDQKIVSGLGNIYVCEALFRAGISPKRKAGHISKTRLDILVRVIRDVLSAAIASGGSSLRDFRQTDGELGYFQHTFQVYDRAGEACLRDGCEGVISRVSQSGRSSFYCPQCQR